MEQNYTIPLNFKVYNQDGEQQQQGTDKPSSGQGETVVSNPDKPGNDSSQQEVIPIKPPERITRENDYDYKELHVNPAKEIKEQ